MVIHNSISFNSLPNEIFPIIFGYNTSDKGSEKLQKFCQLRSVCKKWNEVILKFCNFYTLYPLHILCSKVRLLDNKQSKHIEKIHKIVIPKFKFFVEAIYVLNFLQKQKNPSLEASIKQNIKKRLNGEIPRNIETLKEYQKVVSSFNSNVSNLFDADFTDKIIELIPNHSDLFAEFLLFRPIFDLKKVITKLLSSRSEEGNLYLGVAFCLGLIMKLYPWPEEIQISLTDFLFAKILCRDIPEATLNQSAKSSSVEEDVKYLTRNMSDFLQDYQNVFQLKAYHLQVSLLKNNQDLTIIIKSWKESLLYENQIPLTLLEEPYCIEFIASVMDDCLIV